jgi:hypothetical protein
LRRPFYPVDNVKAPQRLTLALHMPELSHKIVDGGSWFRHSRDHSVSGTRRTPIVLRAARNCAARFAG